MSRGGTLTSTRATPVASAASRSSGISASLWCRPLTTDRPLSRAARIDATHGEARSPPRGATPSSRLFAPSATAASGVRSGNPRSTPQPGKRNCPIQSSGRQSRTPMAVLASRGLTTSPRNSRWGGCRSISWQRPGRHTRQPRANRIWPAGIEARVNHWRDRDLPRQNRLVERVFEFHAALADSAMAPVVYRPGSSRVVHYAIGFDSRSLLFQRRAESPTGVSKTPLTSGIQCQCSHGLAALGPGRPIFLINSHVVIRAVLAEQFGENVGHLAVGIESKLL